ncbi:hypothetical protein QLQ12_45725 [Actinoplanes sp. NEAU-A12]|uniref:PH domain-containing protein n=1 Tax=Actinoplanes sandaracinus TaxID=3045177 RepID=A0ABT6X1L2_9ACTN|nr:hypothetical protein [Actinoplanes sandaracinus]MDI6105895.1 hypothetical protein [Actinoplanes sandaracinus]
MTLRSAAGALVTAVILQIFLRVTENDRAWELILWATLLLPVVFLLWSAASARSFHPAELVARPEAAAFDVLVGPRTVLRAVGATYLGANSLGMLLHGVGAETGHWFPASLLVLWAGLLAACWRAALSPFGVRLSRDGLFDRRILGSVFVPWEALATPSSAVASDPYQVTLFLTHPERVRWYGLRFGKASSLPAVGGNADFLARVIIEYANHPDFRPAIGSKGELARIRKTS